MSFVPYPAIDDKDFYDKIFWKKEFLSTMYRTDFQYSKTEDLCRRGEFKMQNHQEFVRNFVSQETPYNGALLIHGTGVGKCVHPETEIYANASMTPIVDLWDANVHMDSPEYSVDSEGGEWYSLQQDIVVCTMRDRKMVPVKASRLYRQKVSESLLQVTTSNSKSIIITRAHKLLTTAGWTTDLKVGTDIAIPIILRDTGDSTLGGERHEYIFYPITSIEELDYTGYVYDLEVPETHNYVANGILCHNTCAAIGTTEGMRDYVRKSGKKIYILSTENVRPNFYKELYDPSRESVERDIHGMPGSYQCAGDRYYIEGHSGKPEVKAKLIKSMIEDYYEFYGYGQFANFVDVTLGAVLPPHMSKPKMLNEDGTYIDIGDYFNNSIIVIDEAHCIAGSYNKGTKDDDGDDGDDDVAASDDEEVEKPKVRKVKLKTGDKSKIVKVKAKAKVKISDDDDDDDSIRPEGDGEPADGKKKVIRNTTKRSLFQTLVDSIIPACRAKGGNLKILLLTATPMKDNVNELCDLLELLNMNDGRKLEPADWRSVLFPPKIMFYKNLGDAFGDRQARLLQNIARGYISYVKGDNPITFPKALLPPAEQLYEPGRRFGNEINPIFEYGHDKGSDIQTLFDITDPPNFFFNLVKCEMDTYQYVCYTALHNGQLNIKKMSSDSQARMISNMAFPIAGADYTPFTIIDEPGRLSSIVGKKDGGRTVAVSGINGFKYTFPSRTKEVPNADGAATKRKYVSYAINDQVWDRCGMFMMIDDNPGSGTDSSEDYTLHMFSKKLDMFVRNVISSPGIAFAYSEFKSCGALIMALALEANGFVCYHPDLHLYINKDTGLPKDDNIRKSLPEAYLFDLTEAQLARIRGADPSYRHYRCSHCGNLYKSCLGMGSATPHKFNIATYVVVTGDQGGTKEIAEVVSNNMYGHKIKAIIGTKVTGTGVDFKWIRQVHIFDPWHNNTRIYQAIGRGLRHCSHADLPEPDRNVTIFKYSSTTDVSLITDNGIDIDDDAQLAQSATLVTEDGDEIVFNFTYKDLLTETVDEHMYRRVVRKDLINKLIERRLKEMAVDCELNKNRNMLPGDEDYSRECDYMECNYKCGGFKEPIRYVRRIRQYEDGSYVAIDGNGQAKDGPLWRDLELDEDRSDDEIWRELHKNNVEILGEEEVSDPDDDDDEALVIAYKEILVDIPLPMGKVDLSTYDIYFSSPQVDKAVKVISRLFQKTLALQLSRIVHLVRIIDKLIEDKFIYAALNKIVGNMPYVRPLTIIDKFGRKGRIIVHNKFYIYHPYELEDVRIPMRYRSTPLTVKSRYYNMEMLAAKKGKDAAVVALAVVDPAEVDAIAAKISKMDIISVSDIVKLHTRLYDMLLPELGLLMETMVERNTPNTQYVVEYCLSSGVAFFMPDFGVESGEGTINYLLEECRRGNEYFLMHIMNSTNLPTAAVRVFTNNVWKKHIIDNLPGGTRFITYDDSTKNDRPNIPYPHSDLTVAFDGFRELIKSINNKNNKYLGLEGVYGMMADPGHRKDQPIFKLSNIQSILLSAVDSFNKQYPNRVSLNKCRFKMFDQSLREAVITKDGKISKRGEIKGKVCTTATEGEVYKLVLYMSEVLQQEDNYALITQGSDIEVVDFMDSLDVEGALNAKGLFIPKKQGKAGSCEVLKKFLIIANYYNINEVSWFLNPIDTNIHRPIGEPAAK